MRTILIIVVVVLDRPLPRWLPASRPLTPEPQPADQPVAVGPRPRDGRAGQVRPARTPRRAIPPASTSAGMSRVRWHPPATARCSGSSRRCQRRTDSSGASPCSSDVQPSARRAPRGVPPAAPAAGSGIVHRLKVTSALSCESSGRSRRWPSSPARSIGTPLRARRSLGELASRGRTARPRVTDVTSGGYHRTLSPLPKPISSTRPVSPAQTASRSSPTS